MPKLTQTDFDLFQESRHFDSYRVLGAHATQDGTWFAAWAPFADHIAVMGEFNGWDPSAHPMVKVGTGYSGLWECFVPGAHDGHHYKYRVYRGRHVLDKTDPYAFRLEAPLMDGNPVAGLSSIITDLTHNWGDQAWMESRQGPGSLKQPVAIYEVHLGSWTKREDGYSHTYREIAEPLANHVANTGFTHVELLPIMEHPYYPSWGYQVVGYYAPTYRYGSPQDLMYLIDYLHQRGIGVLLDWVPAHFAADPQGLVFFDGSTLYEYDDPLMRYHPDWGTYVFDYGKPGVRNFLISNARFWLDHYHIDGLRFDAVASILYRDYSRQEWRPNKYGGRENLEAIDFLHQVNEAVYAEFPEVMMIAEESTAFPKVSEPTYNGGLGFLYKWNMGWMHDILAYLSLDPIHREHHHDKLTFTLWYSFSEHYMLPLSHDEVVHMKGSLWGKMGGGDPWQKAANLRLLYGHMIGHPGKKLLFMGSEFGQEREWNHDAPLDWFLLDDPLHKGVNTWVQDLLTLYRTHPALWDDGPDGFAWIDLHNRSMSVLGYLRNNEGRQLVFMFNFTPVPRHDYMLGVPEAGAWKEVLNSDAPAYGGSGQGNTGWVDTVDEGHHGYAQSLRLSLPPLGVLVLEREDRPPETPKPKAAAKKKAPAKPKPTARKKAAPQAKTAAAKK